MGQNNDKGLLDGSKPIWGLLSTFGSMVIVNICTIICCLPVITAGASITASSYVLDKTAIGEEPGNTLSAFFSAFRDNFKQSTIAWLIMVAAAVILTGDLYFGLVYPASYASFFRVFGTAGIICWVGLASWLFPMIARYDNDLKTQFANAGRMAITQLPRTMTMILIQLLPVALCMIYVRAFIIVVSLLFTIVVAGIGFLCALLRKRVFMKYS